MALILLNEMQLDKIQASDKKVKFHHDPPIFRNEKLADSNMQHFQSDHSAGEKGESNMNLVVVERQVMSTPSFLKHGKLLELLEVFHEFPSINLTSPSPKTLKHVLYLSCCIIKHLSMYINPFVFVNMYVCVFCFKSWQGNIVTYNTIISALETLG